jgi:hypothetical protein
MNPTYEALINKKQGFVIGLVGKPGSGKTTFIKHFISKVSKEFSYVLCMSPSAIEYHGLIEEAQITDKFDMTWLWKMINMINLTMGTFKESNVLLIIDDFISEVKEQNKNPQLVSTFFNRRHLLWNGKLNIILTSQKYTMMPAKFRSCMTDLVLYTLSPFDLQKIFEESIVVFTKKIWEEKIQILYTGEFKYIHLNIDKQVIS